MGSEGAADVGLLDGAILRQVGGADEDVGEEGRVNLLPVAFGEDIDLRVEPRDALHHHLGNKRNRPGVRPATTGFWIGPSANRNEHAAQNRVC